MSGAKARRSRGILVAAVAVVLAVFAAHAASFLPFLADDALISLRYAERWLQGDGLTWTDGERVEGYSNLAWIVAVAALGALGIDLVHAARGLGILAVAAACLAPLEALRRATSPRDRALAGGTAGLAVAGAGSLAAWAVGGLEAGLLAALVAWAYVSLAADEGDGTGRRTVVASLLLGIACWTRPDGAVFAAAAGVGLLAGHGLGAFRRVAALSIGPIAAVGLQTVFRLVYYGDFVPNSARAKIAWTWPRVQDGIAYVGDAAWRHAPLVLAAAATVWITRGDPRARARVRLYAIAVVAWCAYIAAVGGDIFPARRHFAPVVPLLAILVAEGCAALLAKGRRTTVLAAAAAGLVVFAGLQATDPENLRAREERWEWDGEVVGRLLGDAFGTLDPPPLLAVDPGGTLPYFSKLPSLDLLGINDRYLGTHPPDDLGHGWLGHELGDGDYVLSREPDLVVWCGPGGSTTPCFRSGREMAVDPRFVERYRPARFEGREPYAFRSLIWVRAEGGRVGIERTRDRVLVPGWLLTIHPEAVAIAGSGGLGVRATRAVPGAIRRLRVPPGRWRVRAIPDSPPGAVVLEVRATDAGAVLASGTDSVAFEVLRTGHVDILAAPAGSTGDVWIRALELRREP